MGVLEGGKIVGVLGQRREASLAEMSLQANQLFRFEMAGDLNLNDGQTDAKGVSFPSFPAGSFINIGNTCYMASVLQAFLNCVPVKRLIEAEGANHLRNCKRNAPDCITCQFVKVAFALYNCAKIAPWMLRHAVAKVAQSFASGQQGTNQGDIGTRLLRMAGSGVGGNRVGGNDASGDAEEPFRAEGGATQGVRSSVWHAMRRETAEWTRKSA